MPLVCVSFAALNFTVMKRSHIVILIAIAIAIGALIMLSVDFSTYDTVASARKKQGKFVHLIARLDKSIPMDYDPATNPNYLSFVATDSLGGSTKVVYHNTKPAELEHPVPHQRLAAHQCQHGHRGLRVKRSHAV